MRKELRSLIRWLKLSPLLGIKNYLEIEVEVEVEAADNRVVEDGQRDEDRVHDGQHHQQRVKHVAHRPHREHPDGQQVAQNSGNSNLQKNGVKVSCLFTWVNGLARRKNVNNQLIK